MAVACASSSPRASFPLRRCQTVRRSKPTARSRTGIRASSRTCTSTRYAPSSPHSRPIPVSVLARSSISRIPPARHHRPTTIAALAAASAAAAQRAPVRRDAVTAGVWRSGGGAVKPVRTAAPVVLERPACTDGPGLHPVGRRGGLELARRRHGVELRRAAEPIERGEHPRADPLGLLLAPGGAQPAPAQPAVEGPDAAAVIALWIE